MKKFKKILILNRSEIACRLIQACQEMGIKTVALYSDPDRGSRPTVLADEAYHLPGSSPKETYLNLEKILEIAKHANCDAVHPGYGFLSERAGAAEKCIEAGLTWIGPSPDSIRQLGDKLEAKKLLQTHQVPTAPWGEVKADDPSGLQDLANHVGYPILLKAASGGGGKGMRLVKDKLELLEAASSAAREAAASFGDATLLLEKYIEKPRHIEIQILGDSFGNLIHFGERECSLQRRHQKVIEEAPAPNLSDQTKSKMAECSVRLAKAVGYSNAGTVEFLVDANENFYFLEVNSRLQVEHSVTEAVWGIDLVKAQIEVAQGKSLEQIFPHGVVREPRGHAIQARVYAENAETQFSPCPGNLALVEWPTAVGLRIDSGVKTGSTIGLDYDAMIAKLTAHAPCRNEALDRIIWSLKNSIIFGTVTNINYLQDILSHPKVRSGTVHVKWLETEFSPWSDPVPSELKKIKVDSSHTSELAVTKGHASPWETL